jgi:EmrB/QacA subfamily drug resistance transporter
MAVLLDALDFSIVNIAIPNIMRDLNMTKMDLQWVQGAYFLTYAGFMLLGGRFADLLGRRRIFIIGTTIFGLASLICALADSGFVLIVARGLQGIGAALTLPSAVSIITTSFSEGPERNKALGIFSAIAGSGFTLGLVLGGLLTNFINWRWVFYVNIPFVLLIVVLARFVVSEGRSMARSRSYDIAGAVTGTGGLLLLVYSTTQLNNPYATLLSIGGLFTLSLFILAVFIIIEMRSKAPLLPMSIFRSSTTRAANIASLTLLGSFTSFLFIATLYLQEVLHYSPVLASLAVLPGGLLSVIVAIGFTPWLVNRLGMRLTSGIGLLCMASGIALFAQIGLNDNYVGIILPSMILVIALGMGIGYPAIHIAAVSGFENKDQGLAAGLQGTSEQAGGGLCLAITTAVVTASMGSSLSDASQLSGFRAGLYVAAAELRAVHLLHSLVSESNLK